MTEPSPPLEAVLTEFGAALRRVAASYAGAAAARDDLLQEIAMALWRALPRFRGECSLRAFVLRIAHNRGLTFALRRPPPALPIEEAALAVADAGAGPQRRVEAAERRELLWSAIRRLPPIQRQLLTLHLEGLTAAEVGEVLGITENNVNVRLTRARQALRAELGGRPGEKET